MSSDRKTGFQQHEDEHEDPRRLSLRPGLIGSAAALVVSAGISVWGWLEIPDGARLPMHYGAAGEVDRYGGKVEALLSMPAVIVGLCVLFCVLPFVLPRRENLAGSALAYNGAWIGVLALLTGIHAVTVINATGGDIPVPRVAMAGVGVLLLVLGNYLPKTRGNWAVGVRTPWTMDSEESWRRTHRLAGRLFAVVGLVLAVAAFVVPLPALVPIALVGPLAACLIPAIYSWWTWRADQNENPGATPKRR